MNGELRRKLARLQRLVAEGRGERELDYIAAFIIGFIHARLRHRKAEDDTESGKTQERDKEGKYADEGKGTGGGKIKSDKTQWQNNSQSDIIAGMETKDVTSEYREKATPGVGKIEFDDGYDKAAHKKEIEIADLLHNTFGGDIRILKESNIDSQKTPDFIWRGKFWELKSTSSVSGADKMLQKAIKQIAQNTGGVIFAWKGNSSDMPQLEEQLSRRVERSNVSGIDIIIIKDGDFAKAIRYKK